MPKEVRLNDKMWFGKHRGSTIKDILNVDRNFLDVLVAKGKITFHQNIIDYLKEESGYGYKTSSRGYWGAPQEGGWEPIYIDPYSSGNIGIGVSTATISVSTSTGNNTTTYVSINTDAE